MNDFLGFFGFLQPASYNPFLAEECKKDVKNEEPQLCYICLDPISAEASVAHEGEGTKHPLHTRCLVELVDTIKTEIAPCPVCKESTRVKERASVAGYATFDTSLIVGIAAKILGLSCLDNR